MFDCTPPIAPAPLIQSAAFEAALRACGEAPVRLDCGTLMLRRKLWGVPVAMLPRAPMTDPARTLAHARDLTRGPVLVSPLTPLALSVHGALPMVSPASQALISLQTDTGAMRAALHGKWRNRLKHGEKAGLRVQCHPLPRRSDHWLLHADAAQQRERGYRSVPVPLTLGYAATTPRAAILFEAFQGPDPVAALLILRHGATATYHIGHTTHAGRAVSAHTLLMWTAMCWCADHGHHWLDLGLIQTGTAAGLARFKLGTGAHVRSLGGTWLHWPPLRALRGLAWLDRKTMFP
ncbi:MULTISPECIES: GNAT family N-acetyltransferase [Roseobacteraceae]|jgi:hypothetical protein|uniref:Acetyltransferase (GNAT) domain protein n=1 Tax=Pseudosulfitobacter pseudonitzschiae TaxID=1402135 RepID=A0A221JZF4_9RHOB|nr:MULTISPECIES: GNAT family N-acetyltransferase [Roseobacteraceae]ASM72111.1 acetyltransferase (GNAT) domain protein [Pseudosulfitobacter pseudonitzschiae]